MPCQEKMFNIDGTISVKDVLAMYREATDGDFSGNYIYSVGGQPVSEDHILEDGDYLLGAKNMKANNEDESGLDVALPPVVTAPTKVVGEKVINAFQTGKNMFSAKKYEDNPVRFDLVQEVSKRLATVQINADRAAELEIACEKLPGKKVMKWNNSKLLEVTAKQYAQSELADKIANLANGTTKAAYEEMLAIVNSWSDEPIKAKCPHTKCNTSAFVTITKNEDGKFICSCTNPNHKTLVSHEPVDTELEAIEAWNAQVQ
jgi:hypothetical protein